jgi:Na+-transporting NADH:ubiquinone oxidoreductase subunit NqrE
VLVDAALMKIFTVVITKYVASMIVLVAMEFAVLKVNSAIMACVLIVIQHATLMKNVVLELLVAGNVLGGNVAIAQMHVHDSKHAPIMFVAMQ